MINLNLLNYHMILKMLKEILKSFIYGLPIKMKNYILLESIPTYSDNTKNVFLEMINRNINQKYKMIWITDEDTSKFSKIKYDNVYFINKNKINKVKLFYLRLHAKIIIDNNQYIIKLNKGQLKIHLTHGMPLKATDQYCRKIEKVDYITANSDFFKKELSKLFNIDEKCILITGSARNDDIIKNNKILFPEFKRKKTIIWMPTYRNHKKTDSYEGRTNIKFKYGIPCVNSEEELFKLNNILKNNEELLIIKLHPQEDRKNIKKLELSNIKLLDNDYFEYDESIYDYLSSVDALITDYSTIYYDFLLTNKMIGLAIPDFKEYSKHVRLATKNYKKDIVGEYIYSFADLEKFVYNVANNIDDNLERRIKANKLYNKYHDGNSAKRIVDYIEDKMKGNKSEKK